MADRTFKKYGLSEKDKLMVELLEEIHAELIEVNENLRRLLGARPSPS